MQEESPFQDSLCWKAFLSSALCPSYAVLISHATLLGPHCLHTPRMQSTSATALVSTVSTLTADPVPEQWSVKLLSVPSGHSSLYDYRGISPVSLLSDL